MPRKTTYADLLGSRQRELLVTSVIEALREGTSLDTTLRQFIAGVTQTPAVKDCLAEISLGQIFGGVLAAAQPHAKRGPGRPPKARVGRPPKAKGAPKVKAKVGRPPKAKKAAKAKGKVGRPPKAGKRQRADARTVTERMDAIHRALKEIGGWVKTGALHEKLAKQRLFAGVVPNTLSQYLAKFADEPKKRVLKKGKRATSVYKAV